MSYGDYVTEVDFTRLSQCLITGTVIDDENREVYDSGNPIPTHKSNGAGKSTIVSVLQWVLFGRTMHSPNPGNKVVNWFTGKDCWGKIEFKNGDSITRTRNTNGHNELLFIKDGNEIKTTADTVSTSKAQQQKLAKEFNLDWDVFCGSVFFNQYGKPWMEMADQHRKKAIERILHIDRFIYYAKIAKDKTEVLDSNISKNRSRIADLTSNVDDYQEEIQRLSRAVEGFADNQEQRKLEFLRSAENTKATRDAIVLPDMDILHAKWVIVRKVERKIEEYRDKSDELASSMSELQGSIRSVQGRIKIWQERGGKTCSSCEQEIASGHTASKIAPLTNELNQLQAKLNEVLTERAKVDATIRSAKELLASKTPDITTRDAERVHAQWQNLDKQINSYKASAERVTKESNPHEASLELVNKKLSDCLTNIAKLEKEIERETFMFKHYNYIYKAYNDRTKIKSYVFQDHIPFINARLKHYLEVFGLDIHIELTSSLGVQSNLWGYEFESGGERKRTDVAFMLAMFDFHEQMYGRQCNIMVMDEVDGRLDDDGIDALINVIKNDLAPKVETILVISHRNLMFDTFAQEMKVTRTNRLSQLAII